MIFKGECEGVFNNKIVVDVDDDTVNYFRDHLNKPLKFEVKNWRENRTLAQNALYWACVHDLAKAIDAKANEVHLLILKQVQKPVTYEIRQDRLDALKNIWRTFEVVGESKDADGNKTYIINCFFGSEYMDVEEFSYLLNVIIAEMKECEIAPPSREMKAYLDVLQH